MSDIKEAETKENESKDKAEAEKKVQFEGILELEIRLTVAEAAPQKQAQKLLVETSTIYAEKKPTFYDLASLTVC